MNAVTDAARRARTMLASARRHGMRGSAQRLVSRLSSRLGVTELEFSLLPGDIADSRALDLPSPTAAGPTAAGPVNRSIVIGWLCTPPDAGSGGHTTLFRMVAALERAGHTCVILLYDRYDSDFEERVRIIRRHWPQLGARIVSVDDGFEGIDACVASSWQTAHVLATRSAGIELRRLYFIQDYEPFFYPRGWQYDLAEDSYRFGFTNIALGPMIARMLGTDLRVACEQVEFGIDRDVYRLENTGEREGVVFYERPSTDRRGFELAKLALVRFHELHPEQPIHLYGSGTSAWPIPVVRHGRLSPAELNALYNESIAGLTMSFTNVSLVPDELLAAGAIPVMNDSPPARASIAHPEIVWAPSTPGGLAEALARTVEAQSPERSARAAATTRQTWAATEAQVARIVLGASSRPAHLRVVEPRAVAR